MKMKGFVISFVIFAGFMTGLLNFSGELFRTYDVDAVNSSQYRELENVRSDIGEERSKYIEQNQDLTNETNILNDIEENVAFIPTLWRGLTNIYKSGNALTKAIEVIGAQSKFIPPYVSTMLVSAILTFVIFAILNRG